ncbi:DNA helicase-2/ATP-dependent DNA helicase PcrA [Pullulanibacillus pueri]|uniref:DNA 3'-5' helicase n=1 Tax=Pullulanibacillus pueri TaxID=1437324 RepID=A0A8J2ZXU5_9BACL|nr:UvrD-helicase domain-containing protein [Pullulanibacillus pueri]MBM7684025.1 DNA helicase-2/ATP-dependent DNA helicase PcrA [Pullulanibacillus pueri]GGH85051.1 DNA helicase [Pullulanibacillus pueri]
MKEKQYSVTPSGSVNTKIPISELASKRTSKDLIEDSEFDAFFFRSLEHQGTLLNEAQIAAVRHTEGPFLTLAGAGSGKTSVLISRTGYLINVLNVSPRNILLVTFTRKAAGEMKARIAKLPGLTPLEARQIQANTFHAFFLTILRHQGIREEILSSDRYRQIIMKKILKSEGLQDDYQPEALLGLFSHFKINRMTMADIPDKTPAEKEQKNLFRRYEEWKKQHRQMDFDDILVKAYDVLMDTPQLLRSLQARFQYVMVDEFQDTNALQYELIKLLVAQHQNLFVVGDDDQTIYSFNGASNHYILNFHKQFPSSQMTTLTINYRSSAEIVGLGNQVIAKNHERKMKVLQAVRKGEVGPKYLRPDTIDEEADIVVERIKKAISQDGRSFRDCAILHRTANNSRAIFEALILNDIPFIPYSLGQENFYEQWIVKPVVDYLRLAENPRHFEAIEGVLPSLYINRQQGMDWIQRQERSEKKKYPLIHLKTLSGLKQFQIKAIEERMRWIKKWWEMPPLAAIKSIRKEFYDAFLEANHEKLSLHKEMIKETLDELETSAKRFAEHEDFLRFVEDMIQRHKDMQHLKSQSEANAVSLMTIHRAKGLEFPVVYLIGASEGILPHSSAIDAEVLEDKRTQTHEKGKTMAAIEEERRLAYVAITRAMDELYISSPIYYRGKKTEVSRFILSPFVPEARQKEEVSSTGKRETTSTIRQAEQRTDEPQTFLAWLCTSQACIAWQRIQTHEEATQKSKVCPVCSAKMVQGVKEQ